MSILRPLRMRLDKLIGVQVMADGIVLQQDGRDPKPFVFRVEDPQFLVAVIRKAPAVSRVAPVGQLEAPPS